MTDTSPSTLRERDAVRKGIETRKRLGYKKEGLTLYLGDCVELMKTMAECSIDTVITDPPYGLEFMGLNWDRLHKQSDGIVDKHRKPPGNPPNDDSPTDMPASPNAIQEWHRQWATEALRVAKPGGMLLAFGGTRTFHRLTCALEDAGWQIRDCLMWLNGQGFPKSHNLGNAVDKLFGCKNRGHAIASGNKHHPTTGKARAPGGSLPRYDGRTPEGRKWAGWGTALKPAWEPIILAMKPLDGTFARNSVKHGVAGLHIDGARIEGPPAQGVWGSSNATCQCERKFNSSPAGAGYRSHRHPLGRWPANVLFTHHSDCALVGTTRIRGSPSSKTFHPAYPGTSVTSFLRGFAHPGNGHGDSKGMEIVAVWDCHAECPVRLLDQQSVNHRASQHLAARKPSRALKHCHGDRKGRRSWESHDNIGVASRFFYCAKASRSERNAGLPAGSINQHPTIKPLKLMEYLCKLTATPTGGLILDPFAGTGTTLLAARNIGRECIGIELDAAYVKIAKRRLAIERSRASTQPTTK